MKVSNIALLCPLVLLPTSSYGANTKVVVGFNNTLRFEPPNFNSTPGDIITFEFHQKNHSVFQSSFADPCVPLAQSTGIEGFSSGFKPVAANVTSDFPTFQITINDTKPAWGYCGQTGHCQQGMVFGFNTPSYGNTFAAFQELAIESNATTSSTPSGSPSGSTDHHILVGPDGQLVYSPSNITAKPGDTVTFFFNPKNHTVTQSNFANPCVPLANSTGKAGFFSGFEPVGVNVTSNLPQFQIKVNDTNPIWGYCSQTGHCQQGMVFSINAPPNGTNTFAAFQELAIKSNATASSTTTTASSTPSGSYSSGPTDHQILVGPGGQLVYSPSNITANPGDTVTFTFNPKNHTVTQSNFAKPCVPLANSTGKAGFFSGFEPVGANVTSGFPQFQIKVNDTNPIWGYCSQTGHCQQGMVFSINAPSNGTNTFAAFQLLAKTSNVTKANEALGAASTKNTKLKSLAKTALIGIVAGAAVLLLLSLLLCYCCCCRNRGNRGVSSSQVGEGGLMGYGAAKYRSLNAPAPVAAVDTHVEYEPLVPPGEKPHGETSESYSHEGAYDPPPPLGGQYSTAWDQHK